jgi:hypothetical protein
MTIATSEKTPSSVLKEMYDDKNITEDIKRYALLNYHLRAKGLEDVFSAMHNASRTPFQHSLAHLLHSESELKNLLSALDETEKQLSNKLYINEIVTLKDSITKEYNMYSTMRQYPTIFEVHDNENDAPSMRNFSVLVGEKDETLIREAFNKFDVESIIIIQEFMLKPLQNYMFGENKDNEFYTKFDDVATIYQISEDVLKEKQHGLIDKEGIKLLGEIERMSRSEMERFVEEFEYDAATSIFEPTKEEQAKYEYITSHFLSDYDER